MVPGADAQVDALQDVQRVAVRNAYAPGHTVQLQQRCARRRDTHPPIIPKSPSIPGIICSPGAPGMNCRTMSPSASPSRISTCMPSLRPRVTERSTGAPPSSSTSQTSPVSTDPWTAVVGMTTTFSAVPAVMSMVAPRPANTLTSAGTAHLTVPVAAAAGASGPNGPIAAGPTCAWSGPPSSGASPTVTALQSNGAGPPLTVTVAELGRSSSRNCWSAVKVPVTENVPGEMVAASAPTETCWSTSTDRSVSLPAVGATTFTYVYTGAGGGAGSSSGSGSTAVRAGSGSTSFCTWNNGSPLDTFAPASTKRKLTVPSAVLRTATAASLATAPSICTTLVTVPSVAGTLGVTSWAVGCSVTASARMPSTKASLNRAAAMTAKIASQTTGKT